MSNEYKPTYVDNTDNSISTMEGTDTISFCKTGTKINTLSAKNVAHKKTGEDLNLCAFNNSNFNPVITINNNHSDCRITTNLNVNGNVNINNNLIIPTHNNSNLLSNVKGSIYFNTTENMYEGYVGADPGQGWQPLGGFSKTKDAVIHKNLNVIGNINLTNEGMIKTTGIGSFGSITTTGPITTNNQDINAGSGTVTANKFSGTATKVEITNHNTDGNHYIPLTLGNGPGNYQLYGDNNLYYNPSSNTLYAGTFSGTISASNISGSISANSAGYASNLTVNNWSNYGGGSNHHYVLFANGYTGGNYTIKGNSSLYYTPSNNRLHCTCWYALHSSAGYSLVDTTSQQQLSGKRFSGSHPTGFSGGYWMEQLAHATYHGATPRSYTFNGGSFTVNYDGAVLYQSSTNHYQNDYNLGGTSPQRAAHPPEYYVATLCAIFQKSIHIEENLYVGCDKRNKHNIKEINDSLALDILRKINVYTFYFNDVLSKPYKKQFNVLAQDVEKILPAAVSKHKGYLANIMKVVKVQFIDIEDNKTKMIVETPIEEIVDGINVKFCCLYGEDNEFNNVEELVSTSNRKLNLDKLKLKCIENNNTFITDRIDNWQKYTTIVCYGTEDIVLSVDKQIIYSLCHSGIQELDRQQIADKERITNLETKANTLETANQQQQTKINTLETEVSILKTENAELKSIIDKLKRANSFEEFKNSL